MSTPPDLTGSTPSSGGGGTADAVAKKEKKKKAEDGGEDGGLPFKMDTIVELCKRKGFVFQSSEIYSPMAGFFDYGPLGIEVSKCSIAYMCKEALTRNN